MREWTDEQRAEVAARLKAGKEAKKAQEVPVGKSLDDDLQRVVDNNGTPQERAKMARWAFSSRGWPNESHPETVRDFLIEHKVPIIEKER